MCCGAEGFPVVVLTGLGQVAGDGKAMVGCGEVGGVSIHIGLERWCPG